MSNIITLKGTVPVYVQVDLEDKSVRQVVVDDEHLTYGHEVEEDVVPFFSKVDAKDENGLHATQAEVVEAFSFLEDVEWPAWQFGW